MHKVKGHFPYLNNKVEYSQGNDHGGENGRGYADDDDSPQDREESH